MYMYIHICIYICMYGSANSKPLSTTGSLLNLT